MIFTNNQPTMHSVQLQIHIQNCNVSETTGYFAQKFKSLLNTNSVI